MRKWHIYGAIGKGRPIVGTNCIHHHPRGLHSSRQAAQEAPHDQVIHEAAVPTSQRAKQLQSASNEITHVYQRSTGKDFNHTTFRRISLSSDKPVVYSAKSHGSPLSVEALEGQRSRKPDASPTPRPSSKSRQPIDTRELSADSPAFKVRYESADGSSAESRSMVRATAPANIKERLRQRAEARSGGDATSSQPSRQPTAGQEARDPRTREARQPRESAGARDDRPGGERRPREKRDNVDPTPLSRRGRSVRTPPSESAYNPDLGNRDPGAVEEEEWAYCTQIFQDSIMKPMQMGSQKQQLYQNLRAIHYEPPDAEGIRDGLAGQRPAFANSMEGMQEILNEHIDLASRVLEGEVVPWSSKEQRATVLTLVDRSKHADPTLVKPKSAKPATDPQETQTETSALMQKLFGGQYALARPKDRKDVLGHVGRQVDLNKSYYPADGNTLVREVDRVVLGNVQANGHARAPEMLKQRESASGTKKGAKK